MIKPLDSIEPPYFVHNFRLANSSISSSAFAHNIWLLFEPLRFMYKYLRPSRPMSSKRRRIDVNATSSRRIDVNTTSFQRCVPAWECLSSLCSSHRSIYRAFALHIRVSLKQGMVTVWHKYVKMWPFLCQLSIEPFLYAACLPASSVPQGR